MIFFYILKAFDRVWHKGLLTQLKSYGIEGIEMYGNESNIIYQDVSKKYFRAFIFF